MTSSSIGMHSKVGGAYPRPTDATAERGSSSSASENNLMASKTLPASMLASAIPHLTPTSGLAADSATFDSSSMAEGRDERMCDTRLTPQGSYDVTTCIVA